MAVLKTKKGRFAGFNLDENITKERIKTIVDEVLSGNG